MHFLIPFFKYLLILFSSLIIIYFTGQIICHYFFQQIKKQKEFFKNFVYMLSGFLFLVTFYSIIKSGFASINIINILLFLFIFLEVYIFRRKAFNFSFRKRLIVLPPLKFTGIFITLLIAVFSYESYLILDNSGYLFSVPFLDVIHYSHIIETLRNFGNEYHYNYFIIFDTIYDGTSLYHFGDLWFSALISESFNIHPIASLLLICYPTLILILILGILSIFEHFTKLRLYHYIIAFFVLFFGGVYLFIYDSFPFLTVNFMGDCYPLSFLGRKLLIVYIFFIAFYQMLIKKQNHIALIVLLFLITSYSTTVIGVSGGIFSLIIIAIISRLFKIYTFHFFFIKRIFAYFVILASGIVIFSFFTSTTVDIRSIKDSSYITSFLPQLPLRTYIILFIETWVRLFVYYCFYIPFVVVFIIYKRRSIISNKYIFLIIFVLGGSISSLIFSIINHPRMDYWQAFYNFFLPLLNVTLLCLCIYVINIIKHRYWKLFLIIYFSILCLNQFYKASSFALKFKNNEAHFFFQKKIYSETYLNKIEPLFNINASRHVAFTISNKTDISELKFNIFYPFLIRDNIRLFTIEFSPFYHIDSNNIDIIYKEFVNAHPVYRFIQKSKSDGTFVSVDDEMLKFVSHYDFIQYLVAVKDVEIYKPVEELYELYAVDENTGERFYTRKATK